MHERIVGILLLSKYGAAVLHDRKIVNEDIAVAPRYLHGAEDGDKVVVEILKPGTRRRPPMGKIVEVLGKEGANETEMHAILAEFGLPYTYPEVCEQEAAQIGEQISEDEIYRRRDVRDVLTFTIDPSDAKDFDDALSFRVIKDSAEVEEYEIGVHIADVTHYVQVGTAIDAEAYARATSVYLVDRTIPMLPERLCNQICSLRPHEDKLTMSVVLRMDAQAHVLKHKICRTIIRSDARLNYAEAQEMLESHDSSALGQALDRLNMLAKLLREDRMKHGSIDFEHEEIKVLVNAEGEPIGFEKQEATDSHHLIEEYMLLANRIVAEELSKTGKPTVYRVHDVPDPDKLSSLSTFVKQFGYNMRLQGEGEGTQQKKSVRAGKAIKRLLAMAEGKPEQALIHTLAIRTMPKAVYSPDNIGHYGLAFRYYTHFTSPIRRYPDMMVHRLVSKYLLAAKGASEYGDLEQACKHCSDQEQLAVGAERASVKYKQAEWMEKHVGETYEGMVTGVAEYGVYVQLLDTQCEGLLHIKSLSSDGDYRGYNSWYLNEDEHCLLNERTGERIRLADRLRVRVTKADAQRRQISFALA